jgi:hypothetical protein
MRENEDPLKMLFDSTASISTHDGTKLMNRPDLHRFFRDLEQVDPAHKHHITTKVLNGLYDHAIDLQKDFRGMSRGLSFWSFKVLLNNVMKELGLGWYGLVNIVVGRRETNTSGDQVSSSAFDTYSHQDQQAIHGQLSEAQVRSKPPMLSPGAGAHFYEFK